MLLANTRHIRAAITGTHAGAAPTAIVAGSFRLSPACGQGWLAVGDAAIAFDPLSSQGIMTAIYSAQKAGAAGSQQRTQRPAGRDGPGPDPRGGCRLPLEHHGQRDSLT